MNPPAPTTVCPVCQTPRDPRDPLCAGCGLVFATFQPSAAGPTAPAPAPIGPRYHPGQVLAAGRYTVQRALSKGGMGAVYLATDHGTFDRPVVIKALLNYFDPTDPHALDAARQRFVEEARTLAHLRHPAIPQFYAYFQEGPHTCIVMEYIDGRDLQQGLTTVDETTGQPVPGSAYGYEQVLRWGVALCQVLEYLASQQPHPVVHHDIKPANLLVEHTSGEVRLVDFGTAKARLPQQPGSGVGLQKTSIYGTQGYAPPEQYRGESEPRSDVYALAATLYHLATDDDPGLHPFTFPQLDQLGALGPVLRAALDPDVTRRPPATTLGRQLNALLSGMLQTPDGSNVADARELAQWCETHWELARDWLYGTLPDQLAALWGPGQLVDALRDIKLRHHNADRDAGLDALLRLLDPQFPTPQVAISPARLDCGTRIVAQPLQLQLTVTNTGRGYAAITVHADAWLTPQTTTVCLRPGQTATIATDTTLGNWHDGGQLSTSLRLSVAHGPTIQVPVAATFVMQAPDGSRLADIGALAAWCVQHWGQAQHWLYGSQPDSLPAQVERWGHVQTARELSAVQARYRNRDDGLDQALVLLDPQGYGAEHRQITANPTALVVDPRTTGGAQLRLTNSSRRYMRATLDCPHGITISGLARKTLALQPGESVLVPVQVERARLPLSARREGTIRIFDRHGDLLKIAVQAPVPLWCKIWWRSARQLAQAIPVAMPLLVGILVCILVPLHVFFCMKLIVWGVPVLVVTLVFLLGSFPGLLILIAIPTLALEHLQKLLERAQKP